MVKSAGFALILCAGTLFSLQRISAEKHRLDTLQSFCGMLEQFSALLESEVLPMPELVEKLEGRTKGAGRFFLEILYGSLDRLGETDFQELWHAALEASPDPGEEARRDLSALGTVLGQYLLEAQKDALQGCILSLRAQADSARAELPRIRRTSIVCSLAAVMLGIVLI